MGRLNIMLTGAAASGLTALAVTVAAPAIGQDSAPPSKDDGRVKVEQKGPTADELHDCLVNHGAKDVPAADAGEGRALKQWIVEHQKDESSRAALEACQVWFDDKRPEGATPEEHKGKPDCVRPADAKAASKARKAGARTAKGPDEQGLSE